MPKAALSQTRRLAALPAIGVALALSALLAGAGPAQAADPGLEPAEKLAAAEPEFQVNSYTPSLQIRPAVDSYDGGFIAVWQSLGSFFEDTDSFSIQGQRLDEDGHPVSSEFQVNSSTTGGQVNPWVAAWDDGRFVTTWRDPPNIRARVFDSSGSPLADDFVVATDSTYVNEPIVDVLDDSFLVVWTQTDADDKGIFSRLYASDGTPVGVAVQVNSFTTSFQANPRVRTSSDQDFVVVWGSNGSYGDDTDEDSIQLRRVGSDGVPIGTDFQVNSHTTGLAYSSEIGMGEDGGFLVAWVADSSPGGDNDGGAVLARRFDSSGNPVGTDFQVNSYTTGYQFPSAIQGTPDGGFLVAWSGEAQGSADADGYATLIHRYDSTGASVGGDVVVNALTTGDQSAPTLSSNHRGDILVAWESTASAGNDSSDSIQARFLSAESDVAVTVGNGVDTVTPGGSVVYTVEVTNAGPDTGTGVELTDALTSDLTCDWTSVASGGATGNTASGSGDLAETLRLPPGAGVTYTLDCEVAFDATGGLLHSAEVVVDQVDDVASNDSAFDLDALERSTDLGLTLAASSLQVGPGDEVELTATVTQAGPSASSGAMVFDGLPPELTFVSSSDCTLTAGFVACEIPALDPGEMASVSYRVAVDPGVLPGMTIDVEAAVLADDDDPNAANDLGGLTLTVVEPLVFADGFESGDTSMWSATVQ